MLVVVFTYLSPEHVLTATLDPSTPQTSPWYKQFPWRTDRQQPQHAGRLEVQPETTIQT